MSTPIEEAVKLYLTFLVLLNLETYVKLCLEHCTHLALAHKTAKVAHTCCGGGGGGGGGRGGGGGGGRGGGGVTHAALARKSLLGKVTVWKSHCSEKSLFGNSQIGNGMALTEERSF